MFCDVKPNFSQLLKAHVYDSRPFWFSFFWWKSAFQQKKKKNNIMENLIVWDKGKETWA